MKLTARIVVPIAVGGTLAVGAAAIAWADSPSPSPSPSSSAGAKANAKDRALRPRALERRALHGEFVVPARGQSTQTLDTQRGDITAVDTAAKTVTVKSRDGFSRTYVVNGDTRIRSKGQQESFGDLKVGERAMVVAEKSGNSYVARAIRCVHEPAASKQG